MTSPSRSRRRHPARVYWVRRLLVVGTALALVFAVGRMLGGSADGRSGDDGDNAVVAGVRTPTTKTAPKPYGPVGVTSLAPNGKPKSSRSGVALAAPTGPCSLDEVTVTPTIRSAAAGREVQVTLQLTGIQPACTLGISANSLAVRITSGKDRIWSSQQCPRSIKRQTVTVRSAAPAKLTVAWSGRRSNDGCTRSTAWALPGYYHATAAVIGSEPADAQFRLTTPPRPVVVKTEKPTSGKRR